MQIVICTPYYVPATRYGGPVQSVHGLATALVRRGHSVKVFTTDMNGDDRLDVPLQTPVSVDGVSVQYFPVRRLKRFFYAPTMKPALKSALHDADILHINGAYLWPGPMAAKLAVDAKRRYIYSPRGMLIPDLVAGKSAFVKKVWIELFEKGIIRRAHALHATSEAEAEGFDMLNANLPPVHVVANGVEVPKGIAFDRAGDRWGGAPKSSRVAYLGRLDWMKGLNLLVEVMKLLPNANLAIAGPDDSGLSTDFLSKIENSGLAKNIHMLGTLEADEKWEFLNSADCLVVPSEHESFGMSVVEALAVGTPVVTSASVGASFVLRQIDPDSVVERSAIAFADRINTLLNDKVARKSIGDAAKIYMLANYSWDTIVDQMLKVYSPNSLNGESE